MISLSEINSHKYPTTPEIDNNLNALCKKLNVIRAAYGKSMVVTSGLRSEGQQKKLISIGLSTATKSNHLTGSACDILDRDESLWKWCLDNMDLLVSTGLWLENRQGPWVHFQIVPPHSGKRIFNP